MINEGLSSAGRLDNEDPLKSFRSRFHIPIGKDGRRLVYLCGNSLGLQPKSVRRAVDQELSDWSKLGALAHFNGKTPWYSYHEIFREPGARLVGARPGEVVMMNSLTVNLHLMLATFYRPSLIRHKILVEDQAFPSDSYAVNSHIRHRGFDPKKSVLTAKPRPGELIIRVEDIEEILEREGHSIALVLMSAVHFLTGQFVDIRRITQAAHRRGIRAGFDLAHAAGNVVLKLHDWDVDFAVWCSYKYLNAGPGSVAGCFIHERHGNNRRLPRLAGWWGNDPKTRFQMPVDFVPKPGTDGWQVSNPPILAMAPLKASLDIFDEAGMKRLRLKSERLTHFLENLLCGVQAQGFEIITPREPANRGCQLSIRIPGQARAIHQALETEGIVCDFREPDILRAAPVPLYNSFEDVARFFEVFGKHCKSR